MPKQIKKETPKKERQAKVKSKSTETKRPSTKSKKKWLCIKWGFDRGCRSWEVGDVFKGETPPKGKDYFIEKIEGEDPLDTLRDKLEAAGLVWDKDWGLQRLTDEVNAVKKYNKLKAETERRRAAQQVKR